MAIINERERELLNVARDLPIGNDFLEFSVDEARRLGMAIAVRRLVQILASPEIQGPIIVSAARLMFQLNGQSVGDEGEDALTTEQRKSITAELLQATKRNQDITQ